MLLNLAVSILEPPLFTTTMTSFTMMCLALTVSHPSHCRWIWRRIVSKHALMAMSITIQATFQAFSHLQLPKRPFPIIMHLSSLPKGQRMMARHATLLQTWH